MLPLSAYPLWMQSFASLTPFPQILGYRSALVFDFSLYRILTLSISMLTWGLIGIILLCLAYQRAAHFECGDGLKSC